MGDVAREGPLCHPPDRDPEKDGAGEGTRTPDPIITNDVLYQLSYTGIPLKARPVGETPTSAWEGSAARRVIKRNRV